MEALLNVPTPEYTEGIDFVCVNDDQILAALMGETVTIERPRFRYVLTFDQKFKMDFCDNLGVAASVEADEANLRLVRLF